MKKSDDKTEGGGTPIDVPVQDHKESENVEQIVAKPESHGFMTEEEIGKLSPKEKIAVWVAQQEHKNPGFIDSHMKKHGMMKFSTGHYMMYNNAPHVGLPKIWAPGEYEAEKNKVWGPDGSVVKKTIVKAIMMAVKKRPGKPFVTLSTGKQAYFGIPAGDEFSTGAGKWEEKHGGFTTDEHNEAAGVHLTCAMHEHAGGNKENRDSHMTDAVEHMARAGKSNTHHKLYSSLLDKFYD